VATVQVVQTKSGIGMVAINEARVAGKTDFFALEKRGETFHIAGRGRLDTNDFRRANWATEKMDVDGDGYEEVLFTGTHADTVAGYRLVLYVPRTRQTYSLQVETEGRRAVRALWSANLLKTKSPYRELLKKKGNALLVAHRNR
jgi:hypothetical protein